MNNRGSVADITFILIIIFGLAITFILSSWLITTINAPFHQVPLFNNSLVGNATSSMETSVQHSFDYGFAFVFLGGNLAIIFLSWLVRASPVLVVFSILGLVVMGVLAMFLSNVYVSFATSPAFALTTSHIPILDFIMSNILPLQLIFGFIDVIVLFGVGQGQPQQGGFQNV